MTFETLTRSDAIRRILDSEDEIRGFGVNRLALFGSVLRDGAHARSDVDLLVQFSPGAKTYGNFLALSEFLEQCLDHPVDLVTRESLSPYIGPHILEEAQDVLRAP
jgi:hypothetical protein